MSDAASVSSRVLANIAVLAMVSVAVRVSSADLN